MRKQFLLFVSILFTTVAFMACSSNTPKDTAEKFLNAFYHMDYDVAKSLATEESKATIDLFAQFATAMMPDSIKTEAKKIKIVVKDVKVDGDKAVATYTTSEDGNKTERKLNLIKMGDEDKKNKGKWLAAWSKQDSMTDDEGAALDAEQRTGENAEPVDTLVAPAVDDTSKASVTQ